ncbi:MAG: flavodoxin [Epulopiscium sp. Nele67-Bin004]|nr:MAG: flavodoxin [Epulopiscium sp. Nele67-Bin004]
MISVIFWSGSGNTEEMANLIVKGIGSADEVVLKEVGNASLDDVTNADKVVLGCPAMGAETLEESEMEPFVESLANVVAGKTVALFGSYDWGDGEWMRDWEDRMKSYGATLVADGLIVQGAPEDDSADACVAFGETIAK